MNINGKWYTETEAQAYITKLEKELAESRNVSDKIEQIMTHYTFAQQRGIFVEECAEAIKAVCKVERAIDSSHEVYVEKINDLISEVADVLIMAQQMRLYLGKDKVDAEIQRKLDRQIERIKAEQEG